MATQINYIIAMIVILQHLPHKFHLWNVNTKQSDDVFPFYFFCSSDPVRNGHTNLFEMGIQNEWRPDIL